MVGCPYSHQPTRIREETLEYGGPLQWKLNFRFRIPKTLYKHGNFCLNIFIGSHTAVAGHEVLSQVIMCVDSNKSRPSSHTCEKYVFLRLTLKLEIIRMHILGDCTQI